MTNRKDPVNEQTPEGAYSSSSLIYTNSIPQSPPTQIREVIEKTILKNKPVTYLSTKDLTNTIDELTALLIAEYKQLLDEVTELYGTFESEVLKRSHTTNQLPDLYKMRNEALDQCRAIIEARIKELE